MRHIGQKLTGSLLVLLMLCGCSLAPPAQKPQTGPTGEGPVSKPNPPVLERFEPPPSELYDLELTAGTVFSFIIARNWSQAERELARLEALWNQAQPLIGEKKGVDKAREGLDKLYQAVDSKDPAAVYKSLNGFMASIGEIGRSYKLSPLSDIVTISNQLRNVDFFVADQDWGKARSKVKELENTWKQSKPALESLGIFDEITKTHSAILQLSDAVDAENKEGVIEKIAKLNESIGTIRDFYKSK
ncbi:DUF4363 family protein [Acetonema longum]|uniref:Lipoprotein n=1 Tax=Acetonema longum DSM 6540 TaxID=1009370 RepID=F7NK09_9FIRM|nr:DUF4363 family protein [Acetonema longum]EGO63656.1 hypothetical protein ALO_12104 [Acetonema longum DSM 6540]